VFDKFLNYVWCDMIVLLDCGIYLLRYDVSVYSAKFLSDLF